MCDCENKEHDTIKYLIQRAEAVELDMQRSEQAREALATECERLREKVVPLRQQNNALLDLLQKFLCGKPSAD